MISRMMSTDRQSSWNSDQMTRDKWPQRTFSDTLNPQPGLKSQSVTQAAREPPGSATT